MSLINAWVTPSAALVTVDTDGVRIDGTRLPVSKLLPIPHLGCVLALRGQFAFLQFLFLRCLSAGLDTFDQLIEALPELLAETESGIPQELMRVGRIGNEVIAVGYSDRKAAVTGRRFVKVDEAQGFSAEDFDFHVSPYDPATMAGLDVSHGNAEGIARAQVDYMRREFSAVCGGNLLVCHVTSKGIKLGTHCSLAALEKAA
jgi:hypothetical protein